VYTFKLAANVRVLPKVGKNVPQHSWPLKTLFAKAKLLKPGQNSYSR